MLVKDNSGGFNADWFIKQFETGQEGPRLDFKAGVYKLDDDDKQSEFVRDVIAFANVARYTNKKCYILFGVGKDEKGQRIWLDVRNQFPGKNKPKDWDNPDVSIHEKQVDGVQQVFYDVLQHWIAPQVPDLAMQYGKIDGVFVSYLEIKPTLSSRPFSFKRSHVRKTGKVFNIGNVFVRKGASTVRLAESEVPSLSQWNQVAYLEQTEWRGILQAHLSGVFKEMQELSPYFQPKTDQPNIAAFDAAMQALDSGKRLIVITGHAGSGKTVLLHRLAYAIANRHNLALPTQREHFGQSDEKRNEDETITSIADELQVVPPFPVPIFMSLRDAFESVAHLEKQLLALLKDWTGKDTIETLDQLFKIAGSKWIILLDGVDELRNREEFAPHLRRWILALPKNVQVVVTSRPAYAEFDLSNTAKIAITPLTQDDVLYLLMGSLQGTEWEDRQSDIQRWFSEHSDLIELLTCPRALAGLIKQLTSVSPSGRASKDQDRVEPLAKYEYDVAIGNGDAPALEVEPNLAQEELLPRTEPPFHHQEPPPLVPRLAIAVQAITDFMREEEVKRRAEWGKKSRQEAERAQMKLDETAWHTDWSSDSFDFKECEQKGWMTRESCEWNEDIGFVRYKYPRRYQFMCDLLHHYLCAEYAWDFELKEEEIKETMIRQNTDRPATRSVLGLLNEMRQENGREAVNLA